MNARFALTRSLERVAALLRRLGLGRLVDATRDRVLLLLGPFEVRVGAARLSGSSVPHLAYLRELQGGRESYMAALFESCIRPGAEVVDLGAHLGYMTQLAAARGAHVWAFEPNPETRALLIRGLARAGLAARVTVVPEALSDREGKLPLYVSGGGDTSSLFAHAGGEQAVEVTTRRGDDLFDPSLRLDVVKLDVEGGEVGALSGMGETLKRASERLAVFAECNPEALRRAGHTPGALVDLLRSHGLAVFVCDERRRELIPWESAGGAEPYVNLLARRGEAG